METHTDMPGRQLAITMIADSMGVCPPVTDVECMGQNTYRVWQDRGSTSLADLSPEERIKHRDETMRKLSLLHDMDILHGDIDMDSVCLVSGQPFIDDYSMSKFVPQIEDSDADPYGISLDIIEKKDLLVLERVQFDGQFV